MRATCRKKVLALIAAGVAACAPLLPMSMVRDGLNARLDELVADQVITAGQLSIIVRVVEALLESLQEAGWLL